MARHSRQCVGENALGIDVRSELANSCVAIGTGDVVPVRCDSRAMDSVE